MYFNYFTVAYQGKNKYAFYKPIPVLIVNSNLSLICARICIFEEYGT